MSEGPAGRLTVLELFCGIGGCAAALGGRADVRLAVDQSRHALAAYRANFPHLTSPRAIESIPADDRAVWGANLWWLSPPCPPYTRRGLRRDLDDPRARSLVTVLERIASVRPPFVAVENVPGFAGTGAHERLRATLDGCGYVARETLLCPSELGMPNRRQRYYLVAGLDGLREWPARRGQRVVLADLLDPEPEGELTCPAAQVARYPHALHVAEAADPDAWTACFTGAYGRSPVRSGSYLRTRDGLRRFSPAEILRLLDFPRWYRLPDGLPLSVAWRLVGNSLAVRAVRWVLSAIPALGSDSETTQDAAFRTLTPRVADVHS